MVKEFKIVEPFEFFMGEHKQSSVYIPILKMLQTLLSNDEILDKALMVSNGDKQGYGTFRDGSCFKENTLLVEENF